MRGLIRVSVMNRRNEMKKKNKIQVIFSTINNNIQLKVGLILLAILLFVAIFGPYLAPYNPKT